ncbi:MAG: hypothetical protein KC478_11825 [Bacteriovoracaceae bacterium]|nr:hypothetical protein [Bacteriovoracaceae bacterium]
MKKFVLGLTLIISSLTYAESDISCASSSLSLVQSTIHAANIISSDIDEDGLVGSYEKIGERKPYEELSLEQTEEDLNNLISFMDKGVGLVGKSSLAVNQFISEILESSRDLTVCEISILADKYFYPRQLN